MFKRKFLSFAFVFALLIGMAVPASAQATTGSITIDFVAEDITTGKEVNLDGAVFEIWKVADVKIREDEDGAIIDLVEEFKAANIELGDMQAAQSNLAAKKFAEIAKESNASAVVQSGSARFENVEQGVYLVQQTQARDVSENYTQAEPFLINVPLHQNGQWEYDVKAEPKSTPIKTTGGDDTTTTIDRPEKDPVKKGGNVQTDDEILSNILTWGGIIVLSAGVIGLIYYSKRKTDR